MIIVSPNAACIRCLSIEYLAVHDVVRDDKVIGHYYTCKKCRAEMDKMKGEPDIFICYPFSTERKENE